MKCPFCGADLAENARFCLYCMTSLEEKQAIRQKKQKHHKRWLAVLAAVLVFILILDSIWFMRTKKQPVTVPSGVWNEAETTDVSSPNASVDTSVLGGETDGGNVQGYANADDENTAARADGKSPAENTNHSANPANGATGSGSPPTPPAATDSTNTTNSGGNSAAATTAPTTAAVTYLYRNAQYGDDFSVSADLENAVVITGVRTPSANGEYRIPAQIDGKNVIAVMGLAFCDDSIKNTVKKVIVPATVKTIWNYAFANCYNLTDIYFCGNSIYTESDAFPEISKRTGTLTIHCAANCSDRNYRYYKNSAVNYGAQYEEWNG